MIYIPQAVYDLLSPKDKATLETIFKRPPSQVGAYSAAITATGGRVSIPDRIILIDDATQNSGLIDYIIRVGHENKEARKNRAELSTLKESISNLKEYLK